MRLQVDNKFQQVKIHDLNNQNNVEMFTTSIRGGKAFAAEQKPTKIILKSALNMNNALSEKDGLSPEETETTSLSDET